jgi:hypothetical protein
MLSAMAAKEYTTLEPAGREVLVSSPFEGLLPGARPSPGAVAAALRQAGGRAAPVQPSRARKDE